MKTCSTPQATQCQTSKSYQPYNRGDIQGVRKFPPHHLHEQGRHRRLFWPQAKIPCRVNILEVQSPPRTVAEAWVQLCMILRPAQGTRCGTSHSTTPGDQGHLAGLGRYTRVRWREQFETSSWRVSRREGAARVARAHLLSAAPRDLYGGRNVEVAGPHNSGGTVVTCLAPLGCAWMPHLVKSLFVSNMMLLPLPWFMCMVLGGFVQVWVASGLILPRRPGTGPVYPSKT